MKYSYIFIFTVLFFTSNKIFAERYEFRFEIEELEKIEQDVYISLISFRNSPDEEDRKAFDEFLAVSAEQRVFSIPNNHNSILIKMMARNGGVEVNVKNYTYGIAGLNRRPQINMMNLSFYDDELYDPNQGKTFSQFKRFLEGVLTDSDLGPIADDNTLILDEKIVLGALLFINNKNNRILRYDININQDQIESDELDVTEFKQEEIIDLRNASNVKVSGNFPGIYASLDVALQNSKLIEYKLVAEGYKRSSISNFQSSVYSLLNNLENDFVRNIYDELNSVENESDLLSYELHFVSSIYTMDKITLENKSYKSTSLLASIDLGAHSLVKLDAGTNIYSGKSFVTAIEKRNYYLKYEITDFTAKLINNLRRFNGDLSVDDAIKKIDFFNGLKEDYTGKFDNAFSSWVNVRYYPNGKIRLDFFPPQDDYYGRGKAVNSLKKLNSKLLSLDNEEYNFEVERYTLENNYYDETLLLHSKLVYLDFLLNKYKSIREGIEIEDSQISLLTLNGDLNISTVGIEIAAN